MRDLKCKVLVTFLFKLLCPAFICSSVAEEASVVVACAFAAA